MDEHGKCGRTGLMESGNLEYTELDQGGEQTDLRHPLRMLTAFIAIKLAESQMKASLESHRKLPLRVFLLQRFVTT